MTSDTCDRAAALITGAWSTQVIHAAVTLGIADALAGAPATADALAAELKLHPRATFRLLRAMAGLGLVEHGEGDAFALTEMGRCLASDAPDSVRSLALHWGGRTWASMAHLAETVRTGAAWKDSGREGFFSMKDRPEVARVLNTSMVDQTLAVARDIVDAADLSDARSVVDLGGGYGALLSVALERHPRLTGATADLGYMAADATAFLESAGVSDRARFLPTDFFDAVPSGFDVYLLKFIIHDWDDEDALAILKNLRAAMGDAARALIVERIAPARATPDPDLEPVLRGDIQMMAVTGGVERTEAEYDALFAAAGLKRQRTVPTASPFSILEARLA